MLIILLVVFGWWHGISLLATILLNLLGTRMLHYYSTRMVNSVWLHRNGQLVDIEFMNAFFVSRILFMFCIINISASQYLLTSIWVTLKSA